jgi:hypothetical protein
MGAALELDDGAHAQRRIGGSLEVLDLMPSGGRGSAQRAPRREGRVLSDVPHAQRYSPLSPRRKAGIHTHRPLEYGPPAFAGVTPEGGELLCDTPIRCGSSFERCTPCPAESDGLSWMWSAPSRTSGTTLRKRKASAHSERLPLPEGGDSIGFDLSTMSKTKPKEANSAD